MKKSRKFLLIAVLAWITAFAVSACKEEQTVSESAATDMSENVEIVDPVISRTDPYMIMSVNMEEAQIIVQHVPTSRQFMYTYDLGTEFLDKYGGRKGITSFSPGRVVTLNAVSEDGVIETMQFSDEVWEYENIGNYSIDESRGILEIGVTNYQLTDHLQVFSGNMSATLAGIGENDVLRIVGQEKQIWSIAVVTGHGYINLKNTQTFDGSLICIGHIYTQVMGETTVEVPEGTYQVTVANNGYGGSAEVTVARDDTVVLDLEAMKGDGPKNCTLKFHVSVENAVIRLDGDVVNAEEDLTIPYGRHLLEVIAEGYESWAKVLYVNSPTAEISLELSADNGTDTTPERSEPNTPEKEDEDTSGNEGTSGGSTTNRSGTGSSVNRSSERESERNSLLPTLNDSALAALSKEDREKYMNTLSDMITTLFDSQ